ncbi:MAG: hypothetical protein AB1424_01905 [Thermodesulfobacteriota bacterium]
MELGLVLLFLGACCMRAGKRLGVENGGPCVGQDVRHGFWQRLQGMWKPRMEPATPDSPKYPEDKESRLQIRQKMDKKSKRLETHISYREMGRTVSIKCQENMAMALIAGMKLTLGPLGIKAREVQKEIGGFIPQGKEDRKEKGSQNVRPFKVRPRVAENREEEIRQEVGEEERWASF